MAEDDIYNNRRRYEKFKENLNQFLIEPSKRTCWAKINRGANKIILIKN